MASTLLSVSIPLGEKTLRAVVQDPDGVKRTVDYHWLDKSEACVPAPPPVEEWLKAVEGEVEFQRAEELARAQGRHIP